jgi:hypothetical protein
MSTSVLIVERPGQFRDGLLREVSQRGAEAHVRDDAMEALASLDRMTPNVVLVSDDPGPPGALGLCRLLQRKLQKAAVYRLGEPSSGDQLDSRSLLLPRALGAGAIISAILGTEPEQAARTAHRAWNAPLGGLELGPLAIGIGARWLTGRLQLIAAGTEREISFVRGMPVYARSSVLSERLGALGLRLGVFNETQLDQALDHAQTHAVRLGVALLELGALSAPRLFGLLSTQLLEQLVAACNAGPCHARFVLDHAPAARSPLLRMSMLTALLHAAQALPADDVERALDELAERPLVSETLPAQVQQWLSDLQLHDAVQLGIQSNSVRALRARLRETISAQAKPPEQSADTFTYALLRSGALRMSGPLPALAPEQRKAAHSLSPNSLANAAVRCAQSNFDAWPLSALTRARTPLEQSIDDYLHGKRPPETARALALSGPEAEIDARQAEVYALHFGASGGQPLWLGAEHTRGVTVGDLRMRCHGLLKRVAALEAEHVAALPRMQLLQTRAQVERALVMLGGDGRTGLSSNPAAPLISSAPPSSSSQPAQRIVSSAPPQRVASGRPEREPVALQASPAPALQASELALMSAVEPMLESGKWHELRTLIEARGGDPRKLPAALGLLYAIALKEDRAADPAETNKFAIQADALGIHAMSQLLSVAEQSATALVIAKRLLRRRPLDWNQKPPARVSVLLVLAALLFGAVVGFVLHPGLLSPFWK